MMRKKEKVITMTVTLILVVILICIKVTHFVIIERPLKQCRIVSAYHLTVDTNGAQIDQSWLFEKDDLTYIDIAKTFEQTYFVTDYAGGSGDSGAFNELTIAFGETMDGMITLKDVCKTYCIGGDTVHALDHANMVIREGEFVSIIGPSGSGKSTMMNIIGCLDTADEGTYILDGISIEDYTERELAKIRNHKIGFIFQSFNLLPKLTAEENVELPLIYQKIPKSERKRRVKEALEKVELSHRMGHRPTELSGGQQQRVAIARALVTRPSLFLADEPTGNLDSSTGEEIMKLFHELHANGNTIVLITHDNGVADEAERKIFIRDGKVSEVSL